MGIDRLVDRGLSGEYPYGFEFGKLSRIFSKCLLDPPPNSISDYSLGMVVHEKKCDPGLKTIGITKKTKITKHTKRLHFFVCFVIFVFFVILLLSNLPSSIDYRPASR